MKLRSMLQQGFNPDSADYDGRTALMLACVRGHRDVVDLLLSAGEDLAASSYTSLRVCCKCPAELGCKGGDLYNGWVLCGGTEW
jgi:ankyrin repeat protein